VGCNYSPPQALALALALAQALLEVLAFLFVSVQSSEFSAVLVTPRLGASALCLKHWVALTFFVA